MRIKPEHLCKVGSPENQGDAIQLTWSKQSQNSVDPMTVTISLLGKRRVVYGDLTLPECIVGELSNIYHMKDQSTARHALLQDTLAMKNATSLPWTAVRSAWATPMHDVEEGNLGWQDTTQWSINRLSASQISMSGIQESLPLQAKKVCRYYNKGVCLHESRNRNYRHVCNFCKKGRTATHPENKCFNKLKAEDKHASTS